MATKSSRDIFLTVCQGPSLMDIMLAFFKPSVWDYTMARATPYQLRFSCSEGNVNLDVYIHSIAEAHGPGPVNERRHVLIGCCTPMHKLPDCFSQLAPMSIEVGRIAEYTIEYDAHLRTGTLKVKEGTRLDLALRKALESK